MTSNNMVSKLSTYSVNETMDKFEAIIKEKGLGVVARVNHQANAQKVGLEMNEAQVIIFGNPKAGTLIMQKNIAAALDLPMRVVVYKDDSGKVYIAYRSPKTIEESFAIADCPVFDQMSEALDKLTSAAIA
ncbi:DUF302 domain-containing protein [Agarilytica rhodophyticola]|uniref:DUF302 domain-containing protein n=1 Tax=Agarilytica rhodophyticola TaxID=1737490 RepID=UPI000B345B53|nr:DUF302 domain-containing protein [Agarilytica rhodophyticola]